MILEIYTILWIRPCKYSLFLNVDHGFMVRENPEGQLFHIKVDMYMEQVARDNSYGRYNNNIWTFIRKSFR